MLFFPTGYFCFFCLSIALNNQKLLDEIRKNITESAKPFVKEKLQSFVESEVKEKSEHTKSLSIDNLKEMKGKLTDLLNNSDQMTIEKFTDDCYWSHVNYKCDDKDEYYTPSYDNSIRTNLITAFQEIFGYAGKILNDYGYIKVDNDYNSRLADWVFISGSGGKIRYSRGVNFFNSAIENIIKRYCSAIDELHKHMKKLLELKNKLSEQEAVDLWDEI